MGFYQTHILPRVCDLAMRNKMLKRNRRQVIGRAEGRVLEIGAGSGLNLPFYGASVREVLALEPDAKLSAMAAAKTAGLRVPVTFLPAYAEAIPLDDASIDTVVTTWTLCTIPDAPAALAEMRRVLKPGGRLEFVEHGLSPEPGIGKWQNRLTPLWMKLFGGCHLNRPISTLIEDAGFRIDRLELCYAPGPRVMTYFYEGSAKPN
jgi:ubiquinone/menaquinone biosynthesis C-methylase UbiE